MEQLGINNCTVIILIIFVTKVFGQAPLRNRVILSEKVIFGVQLPEDGSVLPGSGVLRALSDDKFSSFTHYQYGTTIRTNYNDIDFVSLNPSTDAGILNIKRNVCNNCYGNRLEVRDRDDVKSLEFSTSFLHTGETSINISGSILTFENNTYEGEIKIYIGTNLLGTFNQFGLKFPQYTTTQRDMLQNVSPGTTIYNLTTGNNQTWSGMAWQ